MMKRLLTLILFALTSIGANAQKVEMADAMFENGKIYVVVGVLAIIFVGLMVYLIAIDRRVSKIEKDQK